MILVYHKVALNNDTQWWVSADAFNAHMAALQSREVVYLNDYDPQNPNHAVITFDGIYANVADIALPILKKWGYPFELFVVGDLIGQENSFDQHVEPPCFFADQPQIQALIDIGGRVQWHTAKHARLSGLSQDALAQEIMVPDGLKTRYPAPHFEWFAYPHGEHDAAVETMVKKHFKGALSCIAGSNDNIYALNREITREDTTLVKNTVSLIIANYNYGRFFPEALDSVLKQTIPPDEILVIDDASTDGSQEILRRYEDQVRIVYNEKNLGIVGNFNKAVSLTSGDYIAFLGADNRLRCDYIERCRAALDTHPDAAIAYTDMTLFGKRAGLLASKMLAEKVGTSLAEGWDIYRQHFPPPESNIQGRNFIHGSSMYRRKAYDQAGGYQQTENPEDYDLFARMIAQGGKPVQVPLPLLEYRQHSASQANTVLSLEMQVMHLTRRLKQLEKRGVLYLSGYYIYRRCYRRLEKLSAKHPKLKRLLRRIKAAI